MEDPDSDLDYGYDEESDGDEDEVIVWNFSFYNFYLFFWCLLSLRRSQTKLITNNLKMFALFCHVRE